MLVTLGIVFVIGFLFSGFAKIIILVVAAGHFYYFLFRVKTVAHTQQMQRKLEQKEQAAMQCREIAKTEGCEWSAGRIPMDEKKVERKREKKRSRRWRR